ALGVHVVVEGTGQRGAEAGEMRAAIALRGVVGEAEHVLLVGVVPLQRHLDRDSIPNRLKIKDIFMKWRLVAVEMLNEGADAALVFEDVFLLGALVDEMDAHAGVEEAEFAQALGENLVVVLGLAEDLRAGLEANLGAGLLGLADHGQRRDRVAHAVFLVVQLAVALDPQDKLLGQRIHHGHAHAVQTAGNLVAVVVELSAGMQHGHDDLGGGTAFLGMDVHGNAAAVVRDGDGVVGVDGDRDLGAVAGQGLVDGVVHDLEDHVVQARAVIGIADVHAGTLAHRFQSLQYLDVAGIVGLGVSHRGSAVVRATPDYNTLYIVIYWKVPCRRMRPCSTWNTLPCVSPVRATSESEMAVSTFWASTSASISRKRARLVPSSSEARSSASSSGLVPTPRLSICTCASHRAPDSIFCWPRDSRSSAGKPSTLKTTSARCGP